MQQELNELIQRSIAYHGSFATVDYKAFAASYLEADSTTRFELRKQLMPHAS